MDLAVEIVSFGYLHGPPPTAHLTLDLRSHSGIRTWTPPCAS